MHIGIWHLSRRPMDGRRLRTDPAGGTETAVVYAAEALVRTGARVTIHCRTEEPFGYEGVRYRPADAFRADAARTDYDAFIVVRHLAALTVPVRTRSLFYWTHDNLEQPFLHGMFRWFPSSPENADASKRMATCFDVGELVDHLDGVFCVSRFQADALAKRFDLDRGKIVVVGNGLQPGLFPPDASLDERKKVILYSLPPDRAFRPLLELFPLVRRRHPDAELRLYSRSTIYGHSEEEDQRIYGELYAAAREMPGVHHFDPVDQATLARAMSRAMIYAYPTTTNETFCISVLEAQAAGLVPVASPCGALRERIHTGADGYLIPGDPFDEEETLVRFADRISILLADDRLRRLVGGEALRRAHSAESSYETVAARMRRSIDAAVRGREVRPTVFDVGAVRAPIPSKQLGELRTRFQELLSLG